MLAALSLLTILQTAQDNARPAATGAPAPLRATAVRAERAPAIDGRDDDEVWRSAQTITDFVEFEPVEGKEARFRTEARVAYDHRNFYAFVRMYDPEPQRILRLLARRDIRTPSDQIKLMIDSYHDRRSGYEFAVNPAGVKRDYAIYNDSNEDEAWDGIWDAATTVDSLGWTAEFRIPLSQLRYPQAESHTFGFGIWRDIERYRERVSWPLYRRNQAGLASQLGEIGGLSGLSSPRRLEVTPYVVTKNVTVRQPAGFGHDQDFTAGADLKYGITSNLTLDATVNPDFGQVEADPAVLNLSAFETFFQERRPFFMEGVGLLSSDVNCNIVNCRGERLFYSRRIGRSPQLRGLYGDESSPAASTILGAGKLTGRLPGGLSLGVLDAVTRRHDTPDGETLEPTTNYAVVRALQELRRGETGIGGILTAVHRDNDQWTTPYLRSSALAGGVDFRHRFWRSRYQVQAKLLASRVTGGPEAIAATQQTAVHYYQRPDAGLALDSARTSLAGHAEQLKFGKVGGGLIQFETSYQLISPGFELNDFGFLNRADWQEWATWGSINFNNPGPFYRRLFWNFNEWNQWSSRGLPLERALNSNIHFELPNSWWFHTGGTWGGLGTRYCDRCARGGPAIRTDQTGDWWGGIEGDDRRFLRPSLWWNYWRADGGRTRAWGFEPNVRVRAMSNLNTSVGLSFRWNRDDRQWYGNFTTAGVTSYTFAHLEQRTSSITTRVDYTFTPTLSFQGYAQAFVSKGRYSDVRELADPRAARYQDRLRPYAAAPADPGAFNFKQFRSNLVLRWEYLPGSVLFLVWQQGREDSEPVYGLRNLGGDLRQLFNAHPDNTLLLKLSYWFDR